MWIKASDQLKPSAEPVEALRLAAAAVAPQPTVALTPTEQEQLHVRVIALENLVIALLATATDHQLDCACEMAAYIAPRPGATSHPLTLHAAAEMLSTVNRAKHFRFSSETEA